MPWHKIITTGASGVQAKRRKREGEGEKGGERGGKGKGKEDREIRNNSRIGNLNK